MFVESLPKVSCLMATKGRVDRVASSVQCYVRQRYPNRELIILSQGTPEQNSEIKQILDESITLVEAPATLSLGAMRNALLELSTGQLMCQWDDDDLYDSERLMTQYKAIKSEDAVASLYTQFIKYFEPTGDMYWVDWSQEHNYSHRFLCGSIMFFKHLFYEFRNLLYPESGSQSIVEEDLNVLEKLMAKGRIAGVSQGHQYIYVYHGNNTYNLAHHELGIDTSWKKQLKTASELRAEQAFLTNSFKQYGLSRYCLRDREEVAFAVESV